jgi:hypothetical protein
MVSSAKLIVKDWNDSHLRGFSTLNLSQEHLVVIRKSITAVAAVTAIAGATIAIAQSGSTGPRSNGDDPTKSAIASTQAPSEAERIASFRNANEPIQALVTFRRPLQENMIAALLSRSGAKPFEVYMFLEGLAGFHSVPPQAADISIVTEARAASAKQTEDITAGERVQFTGLARRLEERPGAEMEAYARDALRRSEQNQRMLQGFRTGIPITYAVAVVTPAEALVALRSDQNVQSVEIGFRHSNGRTVVPRAALPEGRRTYYESARVRGLSQGSVRSEVAAKGE